MAVAELRFETNRSPVTDRRQRITDRRQRMLQRLRSFDQARTVSVLCCYNFQLSIFNFHLINYLGHFYLAYPDDDLLVGNLLGDCVKGCGWEYYPERIAAGIKMHRAIDTFTDEHEISANCRAMIRNVAGKFSGVALDILYDHVLAKNWSSFSTKPLNEFAQDIYRRIDARYEELTMENRILMGHMKQHNWLVGYASVEGTQRSLTGMSKRISYTNNLDKVMTRYTEVQEEFDVLALEFLNEIVAKLRVPQST